MKTVPFEIITPEKVYFRDEAEFVVAPGAEGDIGVLPGHARLLALLKCGELRIVKGQETKRFAVDGGFVRIAPDAVRIITPGIKPLQQ
jgi:F-type H+-transporting ATPase subunit epsilon